MRQLPWLLLAVLCLVVSLDRTGRAYPPPRWPALAFPPARALPAAPPPAPAPGAAYAPGDADPTQGDPAADGPDEAPTSEADAVARPTALRVLHTEALLTAFARRNFERPADRAPDAEARALLELADGLAVTGVAARVARLRAEVSAAVAEAVQDDWRHFFARHTADELEASGGTPPPDPAPALAPPDRLRFVTVAPVTAREALQARTLVYVAETPLGAPLVQVTALGANGLERRTFARRPLAAEYRLAMVERAIRAIATSLGDRDGDGLADRLEDWNRGRGFDPDWPELGTQAFWALRFASRLGPNLFWPQDSLTFDACLPDRGVGYTHFRGGDPLDSDAHGAPHTLAALHSLTRVWFVLFPFGPRLGIGDMSRAGGGRFAPHSSHRGGEDVDIRYIGRDRYEGRINLSGPPGQKLYDRTATRLLVALLLARDDVDLIYCDRRAGLTDPFARGRVERIGGHEHHLHVRFR